MTDCTITSDGKFFFLTIPAVRGEKSRTVRISVDQPQLLVRILTDRDRLLRAGESDRATIGTIASPTQAMLEAWTQVHGTPRVDEQQRAAKAAAVEAKYGISLDEVDLGL